MHKSSSVDDWSVSYGDTISYGNNKKNEVTPSKQKQSTTTSSSTTEQSPFEYIPITALNDYGQSTQLKNAMESASRFGTPVLACICCKDNAENSTDQSKEDRSENTIVVCSLQRPRPGVIATSPPTCSSSITTKTSSSSKSSIHSSIQRMVRILSTRDDVHPNSIPYDSSIDIPKHTLHTAIVTTGIQSDANFLLTQLQMHISKYWFRYDTIPSTSSSDGISSSLSSPSSTVTKMVRDVLLDCLGYDWSNEVNSAKVSGGIGSAAPSYNEQEDDEDDRPQRAGRPLGVCTFLLGLDSSTEFPYLTVIKANGSSQQYVAQAMGRGSDLGNDLLSQKWRRGMTCKEAKEMMISVLKDIAKEQGWIIDDDDDDGSTEGRDGEWVVSCETVSSSGIDIEHKKL